MMNYIWVGMLVIACVAGILTGNIGEVSKSAMEGAGNAVTLVLSIGGMICLWSGLMRVAEKSGLTKVLSAALKPVIRLLYPRIDPTGTAANAISMNMIANVLGLGNASTPLGIKAMNELSDGTGVATDEMITLVVTNSASLQLIPVTVAAVRMAAGAGDPFDILPAVWAVSAFALICALLASKFYFFFPKITFFFRKRTNPSDVIKEKRYL